MLIKHVLSDATEDHVQELAAMENVPIAADILERVVNEANLGEMGGLVPEDAMKDVHEDVQKHAKPVDHPESIVEEPHSEGIALALEHEIAPAPRATPPSAAASSGAAAKRLHQIEPRKKLVSSCPWPSAARYPAIWTRRGRSNASTSWVLRLVVAR